ncbi:MAG: hypothetical protein M3R38_02720 [Actinomycetota bacterium]|nr:hypothetical protein [Actinomycetota bacterium]
MGLEGFKRYQDLCKINFFPSRIGFGPKVTDAEEKDSRVKGGDINRLNARVRLAKDFQSMTLDGYSDEAALGYNGYLQLFLTHSALERFMEIYGIKHISGLSDLLESHGSKEAVEGFFGFDEKGKLYDFLCERIDKRGKRIEDGLTECKLDKSANVAYISAAVRHIFAHGHLTAHANGINPKNVNKACMLVSDFLLRFMDAEFTHKIDACYARIAEKGQDR